MKKLTTSEIRNMWLEFFKQKNHHIEPAKSIVPFDDKSILFINSGVATLKKYFDGSQIPTSPKIANSQKSLRTNDIENVGITSRHHTLFEMLGNFSIGDYFKSEAIEYAYELMTSDKWFAFEVDKLYFTVHPNDEVAYNKWISLGITPDKIVKTFDNFWEIGPGPGGPNSEIFYDRGAKYDNRDVRELLKDDLENDRIIEVWNLVFSEFNCDPENKSREDYESLPQQNIDTGMGLERMAMISQNVDSNFETDGFMPIIENLTKITKINYDDSKKAYRIIADHIRALTFAISDGALPSNDGRGYVIRRILRRAVKYGYLDLGLKKPFLIKLVDCVCEIMNDFYPELEQSKDYVKEVILIEEEKFFKTLENGIKLFNTHSKSNNKVFDGEVAFKLYDTFGFPIEITIELAENNNLVVDIDTFNKSLENQRQRARNAMNKSEAMSKQNPFLKTIDVDSKFIGYDKFSCETKINLITNLHENFESFNSGEIFIICEQTPFYATSGGQMCDHGFINNNRVIDTIKLTNGQFAHLVEVKENLNVGDTVNLKIDEVRRNLITRNHSATHLLHNALHKFVSKNANQAGSLQDETKTRFDFTNLTALDEKKIEEIEVYVNDCIKNDYNVIIQEMSMDEAKKLNVMALFGEKYGDIVRVVEMNDSIELCGGTHVNSTSEIEYFHILSEGGIGSGVRRIEAITSSNVVKYHEKIKIEIIEFVENSKVIHKDLNLVSTNLIDGFILKAYRLSKLLDDGLIDLLKQLEQIKINNMNVKQQISLKNQSNSSSILSDLIKSITVKDGYNFIDHEVENIEIKQLRQLSDELLNHIKSGIIILKLVNETNVNIIVKVSDDLTSSHNASDILKEIISPFNGRGGGKPNMAQGGYQSN